MKNFTKLFLAVVALFAYSCVTDTTEDLGVNIGGGQTTEISISLEESRTQLGEKADGVYPLYWSYDDKISVNGVESGEPVIKDENPASATFTVQGELTTPYCIAYPAAPAGQVLFAENQTHSGGSSFGSGVTTMYGYSNGNGAVLNHLTGVLKIGITGPDNTILVMAQISTADRAPIAGPFNLNFETGELEATDLSKAIINYNIPPTADADGMLLSTEPQYIHVAVPAGVYDELYVTLYDAQGGVMYATIKADEQKPLAVGKVREFTNAIAYAPNAEAFIIKDADSLREFAVAAPTATKDAIFVADVDMTDAAWTPIEGYAGTIHGNGYAIKGLTAPFFGTTSASFKSLHLLDIDIHATEIPATAAFARLVTPKDNVKPVIEHCSASGKIVVDCPNYVYKEVNKYYEFAIGGIVGFVYGTGIYNCVNHVDIEVIQVVNTANTGGTNPPVGGIAAATNYIDSILSDMVNCTNYGDIQIRNGSEGNHPSNVSMHVGGCLGIQFNKNWGVLENVTNYGNVTVDATFLTSTVNIAGLVGYGYTRTINNWTNYGKVTWNSGSFYTARVTGGIGYAPDASASNITNHGDITIKDGITINNSLYIGGCLGYNSGSASYTMSNMTNNGDITIDADMVDIATGYFRIGGVCSWSQCICENFTNNGDINISSRLYNAEGDAHRLCIGGIVGYKTVCTNSNLKNYGDISFTGDIDTSEGYKADDVRLNIGGLLGYATYFGENMVNEGNITVASKSAGSFRIGGLGGHVTGKLNSYGRNSGDITLKANSTSGGLIEIGGCGGYMAGGSDIQNSGKVTVEAGSVCGTTLYVGGITGYNNTNDLDNATNTGEVKVLGTSGGRTNVGGIVGTPNRCITNCTNLAHITVNGTMAGAGVGGCIGYVQSNGNGENKNLVNEAPISVSGTSTATNHIGGILGNNNLSNTQSNFENKATGVITVNFSKDSTGDAYVGGVAGLLQDQSAQLYNRATINITGHIGGTLHVGGVVAAQNVYHRTDHINYADINISAKVSSDLRVGGINAGGRYAANWKQAVNYGNINITAETEVQGSSYIGGILGSSISSEAGFKFESCRNEGNITYSGKSCLTNVEEDRNILCIGGLTGMTDLYDEGVDAETGESQSNGQLSIVNGYTNKGTIKFDGSCNGSVAIGGIVGNRVYLPGTWEGTIVNEGDVICTGTFGTAGNVGGIFGLANCAVADAKAYCSVKAENYTGVGMILGIPYSEANVASNAHCGGTITANAINTDGDKVWQEVAITQENYAKYIYAEEVDDALALANFCGFLSAVDATPVYSDGSIVILPEPEPEPEPAPAE